MTDVYADVAALREDHPHVVVERDDTEFVWDLADRRGEQIQQLAAANARLRQQRDELKEHLGHALEVVDKARSWRQVLAEADEDDPEDAWEGEKHMNAAHNLVKAVDAVDAHDARRGGGAVTTTVVVPAPSTCTLCRGDGVVGRTTKSFCPRCCCHVCGQTTDTAPVCDECAVAEETKAKRSADR